MFTIRGFVRHIDFPRLLGVVCGTCYLLTTSTAFAQSDPPKIHQKLVDAFGVERKTGRLGLPIPPQISVGWAGDAELVGSFGFVDGSDFQQNARAWLRSNPGVPDGKTGKVFDYYTVEFDGTSDTFRREVGTSGDYVSEYMSGSSFVQDGSSYIYIDKYATRIKFDSDIVIDYPDGRRITTYCSGGRAGVVSFEGVGSGGTISNNFGYMLKDASDGAYRLQAVNLSQDYCNPQSTSLCSVSQTRQSSVINSGSSRILINAEGKTAIYRFDKISAFDRPPSCTYGDNGIYCDTPTSADLWYPVGITPLGATQEVYSITYFKRALTQDRKQDPTHDDVFVNSVKAEDLLATYTTSKRNYGSYGSNPYNLAFYLDTSVKLNDKFYDASEANRPNPEWGSSRRSLVWTKDGLNRQTNYTFNDLVEAAGISYPESNGEQLEFDSRHNVIQKVVLAKSDASQGQIVTKYNYPDTCSDANQAFCNKPSSIIDPLGGKTDYTYNLLGQIVSQTLPAPAAGSARPRKVFSYEMRTAYIKDNTGNLVAAGPAVSMLTRTVECSTATPCTGIPDETVTDYDYGPASGASNLTLRSIAITAKNETGDLKTQKTCYSYNYFGEKISEIKPLGNAGVCP